MGLYWTTSHHSKPLALMEETSKRYPWEFTLDLRSIAIILTTIILKRPKRSHKKDSLTVQSKPTKKIENPINLRFPRPYPLKQKQNLPLQTS